MRNRARQMIVDLPSDQKAALIAHLEAAQTAAMGGVLIMVNPFTSDRRAFLAATPALSPCTRLLQCSVTFCQRPDGQGQSVPNAPVFAVFQR